MKKQDSNEKENNNDNEGNNKKIYPKNCTKSIYYHHLKNITNSKKKTIICKENIPFDKNNI